jgi:xylan 1,4-beta-xylosidase
MRLSNNIIICLMLAISFQVTAKQIPVNISINFSEKQGELPKIWRFFGCDEPNYAYKNNGNELLNQLGDLLPQKVFFRTHNLLSTGDGTPALKWGSTNAYTEDANGNPIYNWTILDSIFDTYLKNGVKPYVEIGFMPEAMSVNPIPYKHSWDPSKNYNNITTGWAYPPKDYKKWEELCYEWVKHCINRYGKVEVEKWYWQTWNEPNLKDYWRGTVEEFLKLNDYAINGVLRALPTAMVGGPDVAGFGGEFTKSFIEHCLRGKNFATGETGTPLKFISFHAKGSPEFIDGHVRMNMSPQLNSIEEGFKLVNSYPELKNIPIIIGESDPEGCAACKGEKYGYRNGTMYSSYTAASFMRKYDLSEKYGVNLEGALTWAFEFENQPWFAGFRSLATNGIDKPVLNVFRMFGKMEGNRVKVISNSEVPLDEIIKKSVKENPDISAIASVKENKLYVMLWYYHDDDTTGPTAKIQLKMQNLPVANGKATVQSYLVDKTNGNAYTKWLQLGSPQMPSKKQYFEMEKSSQFIENKFKNDVIINNNQLELEVELERQGVILLIAELYEKAK